MKTIKEQIDAHLAAGCRSDTAKAKVAHDIVLLAIQRCGFKANSTVKGGVVMSSLTGDVRRATMDMDIDFIRYSLSDTAVMRFVRRMSKAMPEVEMKMVGMPVELKHEDYRGKRIYLSIKDDWAGTDPAESPRERTLTFALGGGFLRPTKGNLETLGGEI